MKKFFLPIALLLVTVNVAQLFTPTDAGSRISFSIKNFGINANGSFTGLNGIIRFDPNNLDASKMQVTIDAASIKTGIDARDTHLKKEDYFDVKKYPKLSFESRSIVRKENGTYVMIGMFTIKGISKQVSFPFDAVPQQEGFRFTAGFKINRRDFNLGKSSLVLADSVNVSLSVFAKRS